jgi:two-component system NtrC family sensor kinase
MNEVPKILIIDAEPRIPDICKQMLTDRGFTVQVGLAGSEAMECLAQDKFDLVLLDVSAYQADGFRIIEQIQRLKPETPVIMMSADASVESAVAALNKSRFDYLKKPLTGEDILKSIQNAFHRERSNRAHEQTKDELQRNYDKETVINTLLRYSLEDMPVETLLEHTLKLILSIPWLALEKQGCIFLVEDDSKMLTMKAQSRLAEPIKKACENLPFGLCHCGRAALTKEIQFVDCLDESHDIRYDGIIPHGHYCVPILFKNETLGVINLYIREGHQRDQREIDFLVAVANTLAGIIRRKRLEQDLVRSERLAATGETVAGLAHCIKNILLPLEGGIYVVEKGFRKNDMEKLQTGWDMVRRNIDKVSNLALDLLTFSKDREPEYESVSPNVVTDEVCYLMESWLENIATANIDIIRDFDPGIGDAYLNSKGIHRCLLNLVSNAADACLYDKDPGKSYRVKVSTRADGNDAVIFQVSDNGCGMDEAVKTQLFTNFFSTKGSRGTGLGLLVTQKIIREHKGTLSVESEPGQGTTFTIRIPRNP